MPNRTLLFTTLMFLFGYLGAVNVLTIANAGEIEGGIGGCNLGRPLSRCEWTPSSCYEPSAPYSFGVYDVDSYNLAVQQFNNYLSDADSYLQCITSEARRDIETNFPRMVRDSVEDLSNEIDSEIDSARAQLDRQRLFLE